MKKILFLLVLMFSLALVACGSNNVDSTDSESNKQTIIEPNPSSGYTITFETFGVVENISPMKEVKNISELPMPSTKYYYIAGWYYDENFNNIVNNGDILTSNVTLYALWNSNILQYQINDRQTGYIITGFDSEIVHYIKLDYLDTLFIPSKYNGLPVEEIGDGAFYNSKFSNVIIPNTIKKIGEAAFYENENLDDVVIPDSVVELGAGCFMDCINLTSIKLPNNITTLSYKLFYNCPKIRGIEIPVSVTAIEEEAFYSCSELTSLTIPNRVTYIASYAFANCEKLSSIEIPGSVEIIGRNAFANCVKLNEITICDGVKVISNAAFLGCIGVESIIIPKSVEEIGTGVFAQCDALTKIVLPSLENVTMKQIFGIDWYDTSVSLKEIIVTGGNSVCDGAFYDFDTLTSIKLPESITKIGNYAFYGCKGLVTLELPNNVLTIGNNAFEDCIHLVNVIIPNSVTNIGENTFLNCTGLESITIPFAGSAYNNTSTYDRHFGYLFGAPSYQKNSEYVPANLKEVKLPEDANVNENSFYGLDFINVIYLSKLKTPIVNISKSGLATWNPIANATKYIYKINSGEFVETTDLFIQLEYDDVIVVKAVDENGQFLDSNFSNAQTYLPIYTIAFDNQGIGNNVNNIDTSIIPDELPIPSQTGYKFLGWYVDEQCKTEVKKGDKLEGDITLYAKWVKLTKLSTPTLTVDQYGFASWATVANAVEYIYSINGREYTYRVVGNFGIALDNGDTIKVKAVGDGINYTDSDWSNEVTYKKQASGESNGSKGLKYTLNLNDDGYVVSGIGTCTDTNIVIPDKYNGLPVTEIGMAAFQNAQINSVTLCSTITSISGSAFRNSTIRSISIPSSVKTIGSFAFQGCNYLSTVYYGGSSSSWKQISISSGNDPLKKAYNNSN